MDTKEWLEISVEVDGEGAEAVSEVFNRYGRGGAVIEHLLLEGTGAHDQVDRMVVKTYIQAHDTALQRQIEEALWHLGQLYPIPEPQSRVLAEADWAEAWKTYYTVLHVGRRTVIVPRWLSYAPREGEVVVTLDPGMAFGTGTHPTTRLCLALLEETIVPGMRVLDLGTGSGILAIAAAKQGAKSVLALDLDRAAVDIARENAAANGVGDLVRVEAGSLDEAKGQYDLILVNILTEVICAFLDQGLADLLQPGGVVIASGIIDDREVEVREAFLRKRLRVAGRRVEHDWVALLGRV
jgi:ribosomal protein L11 methyltransferase